jgi:hypothetical protein
MATGTFTPSGPSIAVSGAAFTEDAIYTPTAATLESGNYILLYRENHGVRKIDDKSPRRAD